MKVARKNVYVREDCFEASERGSKVTITAYRNVVKIEVTDGISGEEYECSLAEFAELLLKAFARKPR